MNAKRAANDMVVGADEMVEVDGKSRNHEETVILFQMKLMYHQRILGQEGLGKCHQYYLAIDNTFSRS